MASSCLDCTGVVAAVAASGLQLRSSASSIGGAALYPGNSGASVRGITSRTSGSGAPVIRGMAQSWELTGALRVFRAAGEATVASFIADR